MAQLLMPEKTSGPTALDVLAAAALIEAGLITVEQRGETLARAVQWNMRLGEVMTAIGGVSSMQ